MLSRISKPWTSDKLHDSLPPLWLKNEQCMQASAHALVNVTVAAATTAVQQAPAPTAALAAVAALAAARRAQ
eukprot:scaffold183217_cov16-Tisochrysis_lutea.AAC.2